MRLFRKFSNDVKPSVSFAVLKWWASALCTSCRFHESPEECPLCGTFCGDNIDHLCECEWYIKASDIFWHKPIKFDRMSLHSLEGMLSEGDFYVFGLHLFVCLKVYNSARHSSSVNHSLYHSILVQLASECKTSRKVINAARRANYHGGI